MANSATHGALPYPIKNARYSVLVPYLDADGDPTDPTTPDTEVSKDAAAFADAAEEVTTITGSNGVAYLTLTGAETDCGMLALAAKVASGPKATLMTLYPRQLPVVQSGTAQAGAAGTITLASGAASYDLSGCFVKTTGGTGGGGTGGANNQARKITAYNTSTKVATVVPNWETNPDATTTYEILLPEHLTMAALKGLVPTTLGRSLTIEADGMAHADVKEWLGTAPNVLQSGRVDSRPGAMAASVVTASSIATDAITAAKIAADAITAAKIAANAIGASELATDAVNEIRDSILSDATPFPGASITEVRLAELGAANLPADVDAILADTNDIQTRLPAALVTGTSDSGTTTTMVDAARTEADTDYWKGGWIRFTSGNISGQTRLITGFTPATDTITFTPATTQAVATQNYEILPAAGADVRQWLGATVNALVAGAVDADVSAMQAAVITAAAIATGAVDADALATDAVNEIRDSILSDSTPFPGASVTEARLSELDAATGGKMANQVDLVKTETDKIALADAGAGVAGSVIEEVENRATPAQVNTEVSDVLKTDTVTLPGQAAPPASPTMEQILGWLYKVLRNKKEQTATEWRLFDDAGTTVDAKATVSDASGTATKEEVASGP